MRPERSAKGGRHREICCGCDEHRQPLQVVVAVALVGVMEVLAAGTVRRSAAADWDLPAPLLRMAVPAQAVAVVVEGVHTCLPRVVIMSAAALIAEAML